MVNRLDPNYDPSRGSLKNKLEREYKKNSKKVKDQSIIMIDSAIELIESIRRMQSDDDKLRAFQIAFPMIERSLNVLKDNIQDNLYGNP